MSIVIFKKKLAMVALSICVMATTTVSAQTSLYIKGSNSTKNPTNGSIYIKSSTNTSDKPLNGLTVSNGNKKVTLQNQNQYGYVTASSGLNVRSGPSSSYPILGQLSKGTKVTILDLTGNWYKIIYNGSIGYVSKDYISTNTVITPTPPSTPATGTIKKVVVDAGHGGSDPGAIGPNGLKEKDVTLNVSLKIQNMLKEKGISVVMTRDKDEYLSLNERTKIANNTNADFFISVHANSYIDPSANGTETFSYSSTGVGAEVAKKIQTNLIKELGLTNRGHKTANYYVIKYTNMPSALAELAFISNYKEESLLRQDAFQTKSAKAIVDAIASYK